MAKNDITGITRFAVCITAAHLMRNKPEYVDCSDYANEHDAFANAMFIAKNAAKCGCRVLVTGQLTDNSWKVIKKL